MRQENRYYPFENYGQYCTAKKLTTPRTESLARIKKWGVKSPDQHLPDDILFNSTQHFLNCIDELSSCQAPWNSAHIINDANPMKSPIVYWYRDSLAVLQEILENVDLAEKCVWTPQRRFNEDGERVYTDLFTAD